MDPDELAFVGMAGFEPTTSSTPCWRDTGLRYIPKRVERKKSGQAPFIAPLQPFTLAAFPPWGSSKGAGRKRLTHGKSKKKSNICIINHAFIFIVLRIFGLILKEERVSAVMRK